MSVDREKYFVPDNEEVSCRREILSPSGQYKLVVSSFSTRQGCWNYTRGKVFKIDSDEPIAVVDRNYSAFPFSWIEDHPNGHVYLVCGEDYQGQTVVELDTGKRRDHLGENAQKGFEFCWSEHRFDPKSMILTVCGCHWACPYEFRIFDFTNPMAGWPELELYGPSAEKEDREWIEEDHKWPEIETFDSGLVLIRTFQTMNDSSDGEDELRRLEGSGESAEGEADKESVLEIRAIKTFKREGHSGKFVLQEEWISEAEKESRREHEENLKRYDAEVAAFRAGDPLYLAYKDAMVAWTAALDPAYEPGDHESIGITYEGWCPDFKLEERRWCRRLVQRKRDEEGVIKPKGPCIDLEWAAATGPIKLRFYRDGDLARNEYFEHSVEGMRKAFERAREEIAR